MFAKYDVCCSGSTTSVGEGRASFSAVVYM